MARSGDNIRTDLDQQSNEENDETEETKKNKRHHHYQPDYLDYLIIQDVADTVHDAITQHKGKHDPTNDDVTKFNHPLSIMNNSPISDSDGIQKGAAAASVLPAAVITDHNVYDQGHNLDTPGINDAPADDHGDHNCCDCCGGDDDNGCCGGGGGDNDGGNDGCFCDCDGDGDNDCDCDCDDCVIL